MAAYPSNHLNCFPDTDASHLVTDQLHVGNGKGLPISHTGSTSITTPTSSFQLSNILHVPSISKPLLSVQKFAQENNVFFEFHPSHFLIKDKVTQAPLLSGLSKNGLIRFPRPTLVTC